MDAPILVIDDEEKMCKAQKMSLEQGGYRVDVTTSAREGLERIRQGNYQVLLCDLKMPEMSGLDLLVQALDAKPDLMVIMMTAYASAETAVEAMKKGAYDYLIKPFARHELLTLIERGLKARHLEAENASLREQVPAPLQQESIIRRSAVMESVLERARKVAQSSATVLITGESGTGKELIARAIHGASPRCDKPFLTLNCGAVTETLLESELFGHHKGAFTGADATRPGLFQTAHGGTLLLDEIGEVSPAMQVKLLRVLQSGEVQPVGEAQTLRVDVRVIAATHRDIQKMVEEGAFRTDLFYRLNVVPIHIPPLRERWEDILPLARHFLARFGDGANYRFAPEAMDLMEAYGWPGNVRELENAVEHAVVLADGECLAVDALPAAVRQESESAGPLTPGRMGQLTLEDMEKSMIVAAMERCKNNMTQAAKELGVTRRTLGYRLRKYGLYKKEMDKGEGGSS